MTPEGKVKAELDAYLDSLGADCWYFKPMNFGYGRNGIPDYIICFRGTFVAVECKASGKRPTKWQERELQAIEAADGEHWTIDGVEALEAFKECYAL